MPRISREAVAGREALARRLFQGGATQDQVQKAMQEYDVGGGRKGLKMAPARLAEIETEVKGCPSGTNPSSRLDDSRDSEPECVPSNYRGPKHSMGTSASALGGDSGPVLSPVSVSEDGSTGLASSTPAHADGSISVARCVPGSSYRTSTKDRSRIELTGVYAGEHAGLACFNMDDGRVFKLWADERVYLVTNEERNAT